MAGLRAYLRSPPGLVILFVLVTILPAVALVVLGLRLIEQEGALAVQHRRKALGRTTDQAVRALGHELVRLCCSCSPQGGAQ